MKTARIGSIIVGAVAVLSLAAGTAHARPDNDYYGHDDAAAVLPAGFGEGGDRGLGIWGGDDGRDELRRPVATPLATLEQTCVRRGVCVLRVIVQQRDRTWSCRPVVRPATRDRDSDWGLDGRSALLDRRGDDSRFGDDDDDDVARPRTVRTRLLCVLLRR